MTKYEIKELSTLNSENIISWGFLETIFAIRVGDVFEKTTYENEDAAIDEAENISNETGGHPRVLEIDVYETGDGEFKFVLVD